jgi:2-dehydropantoate 2-reductase
MQQAASINDLRFAVIGLGAIGGYYGGLLARAGQNVHFLARRNFEAVRRDGLIVETTCGSFELQNVNVYKCAEDMPKCDVVLVAIKATDNAALASILPRVLVEGGTTVLIQNGLGQEELLAKYLPGGSVYAGLGFICATKSSQNRVVHSDYGTLRLAVYREGETSMRRHAGIDGLENLLVRSGIEVEREPEFLSARWKKLVWNIPFNGLSVVLRANTAELVQSAASLRLIEALMREVIGASRVEGCKIPEAYAQQMIDGTLRMKPYFPSMYHDFEAGRPLELDAMYFVPIERARVSGAPMAKVQALADQLAFLAERR